MSWDSPDPASQNRTVTVEFLDELYEKADELVSLRRFLREVSGTGSWPSVHEYLRGLDERLPLV